METTRSLINVQETLARPMMQRRVSIYIYVDLHRLMVVPWFDQFFNRLSSVLGSDSV